MTKQEQIDAIAKIVDEMYNVITMTAEDIAEGLYNAGYRKIDDKCVVITKDDLEIYKKQAVKEFAEKLKERLNLGLYEWQYAKVNSKVIDELLKEYEVEEE